MFPPGDDRDPVAAPLAAALAPRYELIRLLGRGAMGAVYLAREPLLDRLAAVKVLPADASHGDARERFLREARTAARLSHPNIVPLYTFGEAGALLYFVMGYVEGESLAERLRREGRIPAGDARRIACEVAAALDYAHQMGVVHRDVKPDNVLLDERTGRAVLADFGVARQNAGDATLTATGIAIGTPHYMSPEQASGDRTLDGRSDVYALGVMTYRMVTGRLPFEGQGVHDVLAQHVSRVPVPVAQLAPDVPAELAHAVTRALAKDPAERWPTAGAMGEAMQGTTDDAQPEELQRITGMGPRMMIFGAAVVQGAGAAAIFGLDWHAAAVLAGFGVLAPIVGTTGMLSAARRYGARAAWTAWLAQPPWWRSWWPRRWRRANDVWDRLPAAIRRFRKLNSIELSVAISLPLWNGIFFWLRSMVRSPDPRHTLWILPWALGVFGLSMVGVVASTVHYRKWWRREGLSESDARRLYTEPTFRVGFWSRPQIARLLKDAAHEADRLAGDRSPPDVVRAIEAMARDAARSPQSDLFDEAVPAARAMADAIARYDTELAQLARDADAAERTRVEGRLASLGADAAGDLPPQRRMRELLQQQLEVFRELEHRCSEVESRRARMVEQLRTMALELARLRAAAAGPGDAAEISAAVRSLLQGVNYRIEGLREVDRSLG